MKLNWQELMATHENLILKHIILSSLGETYYVCLHSKTAIELRAGKFPDIKLL